MNSVYDRSAAKEQKHVGLEFLFFWPNNGLKKDSLFDHLPIIKMILDKRLQNALKMVAWTSSETLYRDL